MTDTEESNLVDVEEVDAEVDQLISEDEYEVEAVVNHRKRGATTEYLVKWKDYDDDANTWEPAANLVDAQKLVDQYFATRKPKKRGRTPKKRPASVESISSDDESNKGDKAVGSSNSNIKKIKLVTPANGLSSTPKKAKTAAIDDDVDDSDFVDARAVGFGSDDDSETKELKQISLDGAFKRVYNDGLDHIKYKMENEDGVSETLRVIIDEKYPSADINWEDKVDHIVVVLGKNNSDKNDLKAILKWDDGKYSLHTINEVRKFCPQRLIDHYHGYLIF